MNRQCSTQRLERWGPCSPSRPPPLSSRGARPQGWRTSSVCKVSHQGGWWRRVKLCYSACRQPFGTNLGCALSFASSRSRRAVLCARKSARSPSKWGSQLPLPGPLGWVQRLLNPVGRGELTNTFFIKCMENWVSDWSLLVPFSPTAGRRYARLRVRGPCTDRRVGSA